jgi:hypothetical protein
MTISTACGVVVVIGFQVFFREVGQYQQGQRHTYRIFQFSGVTYPPTFDACG